MADPSIDENIRVFIRQRPILPSDSQGAQGDLTVEAQNPASTLLEKHSGPTQLLADGTCTYYSAANKNTHGFKYDGCFDGPCPQQEVYERCAKPIVDSALLGYSGTIVAYGPTNSGKTFTMRGVAGSDNKGIMPRCIEQLLQATRTTGGELWVSYLQIYCEIVSDLLNPAGVPEGGNFTSSSSETSARRSNKVLDCWSSAYRSTRITRAKPLQEVMARELRTEK